MVSARQISISQSRALARADQGTLFNFLILRQEKAEKVEKEESLEAENQRRLLNQDQLRLDFK